MLQIFILAAVAIFLFWRLRAVLGSRDGFEKTIKEIKESSDLVSNPKVIDEAKINQKTAFILEMTYCGLFKFPNVKEDLLEKQIKVECPKMLFPYIRRLISQTMIESGMPNIDIKNINFFDLYKTKQKN